jgi:hypothetical protein
MVVSGGEGGGNVTRIGPQRSGSRSRAASAILAATMVHGGRMTPEEIEQMDLAAGFVAVVHKGEVIVTGLGEDGPLAVVSLLPGSTNGIRVCVPAVLEMGLRDRIVRAFAPRPEEPRREVSIVLSGPTVPAPGAVRFPPAELLNTATFEHAKAVRRRSHPTRPTTCKTPRRSPRCRRRCRRYRRCHG